MYNHIAHGFAFALVLLYRIGIVVLPHLLLSAHGFVCAGLLFPTNLPLTLLLVAQATNTVATEFFLDEINIIYTTSVRHLAHYHHRRLESLCTPSLSLELRKPHRPCAEAHGRMMI